MVIFETLTSDINTTETCGHESEFYYDVMTEQEIGFVLIILMQVKIDSFKHCCKHLFNTRMTSY